jgi:hypothetical protein
VGKRSRETERTWRMMSMAPFPIAAPCRLMCRYSPERQNWKEGEGECVREGGRWLSDGHRGGRSPSLVPLGCVRRSCDRNTMYV